MRARSLICAVLGATLPGCLTQDPLCDERYETSGELGHASFVLAPGLFGCGQDLSRPWMTGVNTDLRATIRDPQDNDPDHRLTFVSSDPSIITVAATQPVPLDRARAYSALLSATGAGDVVIGVDRIDGAIVDRIALRSRTAASLELEAGDHLSAGMLTLRVGETVQFSTTARDADGERLYTDSSGDARVDPPNIARLDEWDPRSDVGSEPSSNSIAGLDGYVTALAAGDGTVQLRAGELVVEIPLRAVRR